MKKILVALFVIFASLSVNAQDLYMGGTFNLWRDYDANRTSFRVEPEIGYNLNKQWALGLNFTYAHEYNKGLKANSVAIAP